MFIVEFHGKLSRLETRLHLKESAARQKLQEQTSPQWKELGGRAGKMIEKWCKIKKPAPAIQDQIAECLYEYTRSTVFQVLLQGNVSLLDSDEVETLMAELISMLYPGDGYAAEISARIRFIAEKMLAAEKSVGHDHNSPLDSLSAFRRMLGRHLCETNEIVSRLDRYKADYASLVIRELHEVVYEQSQYDSWEMRYLECERRYHQILNQIGEITRPAGTSNEKQRSPWELRGLIRDFATAEKKTVAEVRQGYTWEISRQLQKEINPPPESFADRPSVNTKQKSGNI